MLARPHRFKEAHALASAPTGWLQVIPHSPIPSEVEEHGPVVFLKPAVWGLHHYRMFVNALAIMEAMTLVSQKAGDVQSVERRSTLLWCPPKRDDIHAVQPDCLMLGPQRDIGCHAQG